MSTRIDPISVTTSGSLGGVDIVGGSGCLGDGSDATYVNWSSHNATGSLFTDSASYLVNFGTITWPSSGWAEMHFRAATVDDSTGLPWVNYDPIYNPGFAIDHKTVLGFGEISTVNDEISHGYRLLYLKDDPFIDFPAPGTFVAGGTLASTGFSYLGFRLYECWIELVDEGTAEDGGPLPSLATSAVASTGYEGETSWKDVGLVAKVQSMGDGNVYPQYPVFFRDGSASLSPVFDTNKIATSRRDLKGLRHLRYDPDLDQQQSTSMFGDQAAGTVYFMYEWNVLNPDPPWVPNTSFGWYAADLGTVLVGYYGKEYYLTQDPLVHEYINPTGYIWKDPPTGADNVGLIIAPATWNAGTDSAFPSDYSMLRMDEDDAVQWNYVEVVGGTTIVTDNSGSYPSGDVGFGLGPDVPTGWKLWVIWGGPTNNPSVDPTPSLSPHDMVPYSNSSNGAQSDNWEFRAKEVNSAGTELRDISFGPIYNGDAYEDDPPHPQTGGVFGRTMTYMDNFGDYNTAGSSLNWFGEFCHQIDLNTGERHRATELDWIFDSNALGLPDGAETYVTAMAVDAGDGTYWFNMSGDGHFISSIPSNYGDSRGRYSIGWYIAHLATDGTLLGFLDMHTAYEGGSYAVGGIAAKDGTVYAHSDLSMFKITGDISSPGYEHSITWRFTSDSGFQEVNWDDTSIAYYHQGIWGVEAFVTLAGASPCGPLYVKMKDSTWFYVGCEEC